MTRPIETFQFPFNSSCTPYNQSEFSPEVTQLCHDENELLQNLPNTPSASHHPTSTNPFSLATSAVAVKNRMRVAKCIVVGDISVGKTTMINRYVNDVYSSDYKATIGVDFEVQKFDILGRPFTLQIWDTAGQSRFRDITRIYYKGAHAVIICFDLSNFQSFLNVKFWLNEVLDISGSAASQPIADADRPFIFLIGTKKDMISNRDQEDRLQKEAKELAEQIQAEFWMVSSANGDNVFELFHRVACLTFNRYMSNVAELARQELENTASQSVFYTAGSSQNETAKVQLPDVKKKSKSKSTKNRRTESQESPDLNGNAKSKSQHNSGQSNRKVIARMIHVPQEMIIKFVSNISEQMQSVLKLRKKNKKRTNKVGEMTIAGTPDSGVSDLTSPKKPLKLKPKKKSFQCFGYRCTFSVEQ